MKLIKVGAAVLNQTALDWPGNLHNILTAIERAKAQQVSVLCLPEMCIPGYGCEDAYQSPGVQATSLEILQEILPHTQGIAVTLGLPLHFRNSLFNCVCLVVDGALVGFVAKRYLAGDGLHYEPRWFRPWPLGKASSIQLFGDSYPLGDIYFDVGGIKIGFEICEDAWVSERPGIRLAKAAVDVILNPSASHFAFGKLEIRKRFVVEGSRAFGTTYVYSNLLGNAAGRAIYDGGALIATGGELVATGPRFGYHDVYLTTAVVDVELTRMRQTKLIGFTPDFDLGKDCITTSFDYPEHPPPGGSDAPSNWEDSSHLKEEEFTRAITLALFDYIRKSYSRGFVVSLSGGADSSAVATLCALMVRAAWDELGPENLAKKLDYMSWVKDAKHPQDITGQLLTCLYQATRNSGPVTFHAARGLAEALGATFYRFEIDEVVDDYTKLVSAALGRELTWKTDDIALQNIQARSRAPSAWLVANIKRALLLSTSNRSEAAVGYATMDGDTAGGLSPIAGIDKAFLRRWLSWMEHEGPVGLGPLEALHAVNVQAPTAELRPPEANQTDEDDLMPYPVLDFIERAAIRDKQTPLEAFYRLRAVFPEYDAATLGAWVERFFKLWCRNQWKRERYAPSFHVDDENLDPKTWCRFPILSGGYARELAELRRKL